MKNKDCYGKPDMHSLFISPHWHFVGPGLFGLPLALMGNS